MIFQSIITLFDKYNILNIHYYLMVNNNIRQCFFFFLLKHYVIEFNGSLDRVIKVYNDTKYRISQQ